MTDGMERSYPMSFVHFTLVFVGFLQLLLCYGLRLCGPGVQGDHVIALFGIRFASGGWYLINHGNMLDILFRFPRLGITGEVAFG